MPFFLYRSAERLLIWAARIGPRRLRRLLRRRVYRPVVVLPRNDVHLASFVEAACPVIEEKVGLPVWLVVVCPCRCGAVLRLNLMHSHSPSRRTSVDGSKRLSVSPSLDVPACRSHFWIRHGRVHWV
jgi:hypothetical protein